MRGEDSPLIFRVGTSFPFLKGMGIGPRRFVDSYVTASVFSYLPKSIAVNGPVWSVRRHFVCIQFPPIGQRSSKVLIRPRGSRTSAYSKYWFVCINLAVDVQYFGQAILHTCHIFVQIPCYERAAYCLCFLELRFLHLREVFVKQLT